MNTLYDISILSDLGLLQSLETPISEEQRDKLKAIFHAMQPSLNSLFNDPTITNRLAKASHDAYFSHSTKRLTSNITKIALDFRTTEAAIDFLPEQVQQKVRDRYKNYDGKSKFSIADLGLDSLTKDEFANFFTMCGKDGFVIANQFFKDGKFRQDLSKETVVNLFHSDFSTLSTIGNAQFTTDLISSQKSAVSVSIILSNFDEIDLNKVIKAQMNNEDFSTVLTQRDLMSFAFFIAVIRQNSNFANMSYKEYAENYCDIAQTDIAIDKTIIQEYLAIKAENIFKKMTLDNTDIDDLIEIKKSILTNRGFPESVSDAILEKLRTQLQSNMPKSKKIDLFLDNNPQIEITYTLRDKNHEYEVTRSVAAISPDQIIDMILQNHDSTFVQDKSCKARQLSDNEVIKTWIPIGEGIDYLSMTNSATAGDWVITGPAGEDYSIPDELFQQMYSKNEKGLYETSGKKVTCVKLESDVALFYNGGQKQIGKKGDYLCCTINDDGSIETDRPYIVEAPIFEQTYRPDSKHIGNDLTKGI